MIENEKLLYAKIDDLRLRAERGEIVASTFLTPQECAIAADYLKRGRWDVLYRFEGGYSGAQRQVLVLYPDFYPDDAVDTDEFFVPVAIHTSGYVELNHRSFLGALVALGIDRSALGDILVFDQENMAIVFAACSIAEFLCSNPSPLERVGSDKVKVCYADKEKARMYKPEFDSLEFVVASARLDAVVAEFCKLSREKAKSSVMSGNVQKNYRENTDVSDGCTVGDIISVRGYGKFEIKDIRTTAKGRQRVCVAVYR